MAIRSPNPRADMQTGSSRWKQIEASRFSWEKEALDFIRDRLPDFEPYRAWANLEFIARDGSINEVDLLVLAPRGLFLIEIKSRGGCLSGDPGTWNWRVDRRDIISDNPLFGANLKSKRLKELLRMQKALEKHSVPFVQPLVFCSAKDLSVKLSVEGRAHVYGRDPEAGKPAELPGLIEYLTGQPSPEAPESRFRSIDPSFARALSRALDEAGIRPSQRLRRVGDYALKELIREGRFFQDWLGEHGKLKALRRIRIYTVPAAGLISRVGAQWELRRALARGDQRLRPYDAPLRAHVDPRFSPVSAIQAASRTSTGSSRSASR